MRRHRWLAGRGDSARSRCRLADPPRATRAALAGSLTVSMERGGGLLAEAEGRRERGHADLDRVAELLVEVKARLRPPDGPDEVVTLRAQARLA